MATNPLISLQARGVDFGQAAGRFSQASQARKGREQQQEIVDLRKQKLDLERVRTAYEQQEAADKRRFRNTAIASAQLKRVLESDGPDAAMTWLQNNQEGNERLNLPSEDTQEAMELIQAGKVDQLKTGLDNNIFLGESLGLIETPDQPDQWEPITDNEGNTIAQRNTQTGKVVSDPRAPDDPNTQVNVNVGGEKFGETLNKQSAERINQLVETGRSAVATERNLAQMGDLLVEGVQTGAAQPALTSIQAVAEDFGINIEGVAERAGIENLSNLSGKEEFDRLAKTVIIEGFKKFKGNLNESEVQLARDAFGNLGKSEEGNIRAIASLRASQAIAKDMGRRASQVDSRAEAKALEAKLFGDSTEEFERLRQSFEEDIRERRQSNKEQARESGVPQTAVDAGVDERLWQAMTPEEREAFQ